MTESAYTAPVDIANRALQILGAKRITAFTDTSANASAVSFVYDKVRREELRRNVWRFAIRSAVLRAIDTNTMKIVPAVWSASQIYMPGQIVADPSGNGVLWVSAQTFNLNNQPGVSGGTVWDVYFGPLTADLYDSTGGTYYDVGELVYMNPAPGVFNVYSSTGQANNGAPNSVQAYSATTAYMKGAVVLYTDGFNYQSLVDQNLGNTPNTYLAWDSNTTYAKGTTVGGSDGRLYLSLGSTTGNNPVTDGGTNWSPTGALWPWTAQMVVEPTGANWAYQYCGLQELSLIYPIGTGPVEDETTGNIFRLPNGYMRPAPDPKAGSQNFLGAPVGPQYDQNRYEGEFIVGTFSQTTLQLRFVADITVVSKMDDMFCGGLAARIALETCEEITQAQDKIKTANGLYDKFMGAARMVNGIETGPTEPYTDDYITVRV